MAFNSNGRKALVLFLLMVALPYCALANDAPINNSPEPLSAEKFAWTPDFIFSQQLKGCLKFKNDTARYISSVIIDISLNRDAYVENVEVKVQKSLFKNEDSKIYIDNFRNYVISAVNYCAPYSKLPSDKYDKWKNITETYEFLLEMK